MSESRISDRNNRVIIVQTGTTTIGPQGFQGAIGPQGFPGLNGPQGFQGTIGPQGFQGFQGPPGTALGIFSARRLLPAQAIIPTVLTTVLFETVIPPTDVANPAYNPATGIYTAPTNGIYEFFTNIDWQITDLGAGAVLTFVTTFFVNGIDTLYFVRSQIRNESDGTYDTFEINNTSIKTNLVAGDQVTVNITFAIAQGTVTEVAVLGQYHGALIGT